MKISLSVDIISDLNLKKIDDFNWEDKCTSLFCAVPGNISSDLVIVKEVLFRLSKLYRGVFYIDGYLEHKNIDEYYDNVTELRKICDELSNVVYLHNHVIILNNIAFVACNGWFNKKIVCTSPIQSKRIEDFRIEDIGYLTTTIKNLQLHKEAKKIIVMSSSTPIQELLFNQNDDIFEDKVEPGLALMVDTESKVSTWIFGGSNIVTDTVINNRHYVTNPYVNGQPYWPKRIEI